MSRNQKSPAETRYSQYVAYCKRRHIEPVSADEFYRAGQNNEEEE